MSRRKTFEESMDELNAAFRELGDAFSEATTKQPFYRKIVRLADYMDQRLPALRWLDDHMPRWIRFGTDEFWEFLSAVYILVTIALVLLWIVRQ